MKKKIIIKILLIGFLGISIFSCDKEVDVNLGVPQKRLIVEGRVELQNNDIIRQTIQLSQLGEFFNNEQTPRATGAQVWVSNSKGEEFIYFEESDGLYVNNGLKGEIGEIYTLHIGWNNETFEATETLLAVPKIQNMYQVFEEENLFEDGGWKVAIDFQDVLNVPNYYFWETYLNGELQILPDPGNSQNLIAKDDFFDGQLIEGYLPNEEIVIEPGNEVSVRQIALSQNAYKYYLLLFDQAGKTGQLIDTPPAPIRGNIRNVTNPANYPLGYFGASEVSERSIIIDF